MKIVSRLIEEGRPVVDNAEEYLELQKDRIKLEAIERVTVSLTDLIYLLAIGLFAFACILLAGICCGIVVFQLTGNWVMGMLLGVGFFVVLSGVFFVVGKKKLRDAIVASTIDAMFT